MTNEELYDHYAAKYRHEFTCEGREFAAIEKFKVDTDGYPCCRVRAIAKDDMEEEYFPVYEAFFYADEDSCEYDSAGYPVYFGNGDDFDLERADYVEFIFEHIEAA